MLVCSVCGYHNLEGAKLCVACGASLATVKLRACPTCGTLNTIRDAYCIRCLTLLPLAEKQLDISLANISDADVAPDPLAALTQALPEAQLDFSNPSRMMPKSVATAATETSNRPGETRAEDTLNTQHSDNHRRLKPIIYLLVALLALVPLFGHLTPPISVVGGGTATALDSITVPIGSAVLLSFDYGPAYAAELDPLAQIIISKLTGQSAKILVMSTHPLGMGSAERALTDSSLPLNYGQDSVYLGYLPGEEAGLRLLLDGFGTAFTLDYRRQQPLNSFTLTTQVTSVTQVNRIIVLSEGPESVQRWIEQVNSQTQVPIVALVSVLAEPQLVPYELSGQLATLAGGWPAALEYQAVLNGGKANWGFSAGLSSLTVLVFVVGLALSIRRVVRHRRHPR